VAAAAGVLIFAFITAYNTVMLNTVTKDAVVFRAKSVLKHETEYDETIAERIFTESFIEENKIDEDIVPPDYIIDDFEQQTSVTFRIVWPWENTVTMEVRDIIPEVDYQYIGSETGTVTDLPVVSGEYAVVMVKNENHWQVDSMTIKTEIVVEEPQPSATPSYEVIDEFAEMEAMEDAEGEGSTGEEADGADSESEEISEQTEE